MLAAFAVLTVPTLSLHIVDFQSGMPYAVLAFEPDVYAAEAKHHQSRPRTPVDGASFLHHALLTDNDRMANRLFRMRVQPQYTALLQFAPGSVLKLVCKRGPVQLLERLHNKPSVQASWPNSLLRITLSALEHTYPSRSPEDLARFHADQKNKSMWLTERHPEACTELVGPHPALFSAHDLRDLLEDLLAANAIDLRGFAWAGSLCFDVSFFEMLLRKYPTVFTREFVQWCATHGNLDAVTFIHEHESELPHGLFSPATMDAAAAAAHGHLAVVRFLRENRAERYTEHAIDCAARGGHLDMVKFLHENRVEEFSDAIQDPTSWQLNEAVKYVRSVWAKRAITSDDPVQALRAAVIQLTDVEAVETFHNDKHPMGCTGANHRHGNSLLQLAIEEQKDEFAAYLVNNCEHARASIGLSELLAAGCESHPLNLELLDLLMANEPSGKEAERGYTDLLRVTAELSNLPFVKALLKRGVPCSDNFIVQTLDGGLFDVGAFLMDEFPDRITKEMLLLVAYRGEHAYLFKLHTSHPHLWDSSIISEVLSGGYSQNTTWEVVRSLHERCSSMALDDDTVRLILSESHDDMLLFMWLVWQDPKIAPSLAAADRGHRLHLYSRLHALVSSLFAAGQATLPWSYQLHFLRQRVESGELTLVDVERARNETKLPSVACDMITLA